MGEYDKGAYDIKANAGVLDEGTRVLVRNLREKGGPGKLRAYWEDKVYRVVERRGEGPVYVVRPEQGEEVRVLHRNHLLPVSEKLREVPEIVNTKKQKSTGKQKESRTVAKEEEDDRESDGSETSENERREVRPKRQRKKLID